MRRRNNHDDKGEKTSGSVTSQLEGEESKSAFYANPHKWMDGIFFVHYLYYYDSYLRHECMRMRKKVSLKRPREVNLMEVLMKTFVQPFIHPVIFEALFFFFFHKFYFPKPPPPTFLLLNILTISRSMFPVNFFLVSAQKSRRIFSGEKKREIILESKEDTFFSWMARV